MSKSRDTKSVLAEARRLAGLPVKLEAAPKDPAQVASKEFQAPPEADKEGGYTDAGNLNKEPKTGGFTGGPDHVAHQSDGPGHAKDGVEISAGGGTKAPSIGGAKDGAAQIPNTAPAPAADKEGGYSDAGGDAKVAKDGGASPGDANRKDDGLRSATSEDLEVQYREARNARMYELVSMFSEQ